jgi:hypothetical protein
VTWVRGAVMSVDASQDALVPKAYKGYKWIVKDEALLGGKLAIRGTRHSVAQVLE